MTADYSLIRVLIADDHPVVRAGLVSVLGAEPDMRVVGEAKDGAEAVALVRANPVDVVLIDLRMPVLDGVEAIRAIVTTRPDTRCLALTSFDLEGDIRRALDAGASGYLLKDLLVSDVVDAVRAVYAGERVVPADVAQRMVQSWGAQLTAREEDVLRLVATGQSNAEIAESIGRTEETVKAHLKNIFAKLHVRDRTEAVTTAVARGLIRLE